MYLIKKLVFPLTAIVVIAGIGFTFVTLYPERYSDGLQIQDITGDSSVLQNITIKGKLADEVQQTDFEFTDEGLKKRFHELNRADAYRNSLYNNPDGSSEIYPQTEIAPDASVEKFTYEGDSGGVTYGEYRYSKGFVSYRINHSVTLKTDIVLLNQLYIPFNIDESGEEKKSTSVEGGYPAWIDYNPVVELNGRKYLYTFTDSYCDGYGGVYDITDYDNPPNTYNQINTANEINLPNLAPVDLEGGKIQIEGMASVQDRLVYFIVKDRFVYLRPFNLTTGSFEEDIKVGVVPKGNTGEKSNGAFSSSGKRDTTFHSDNITGPFIQTSVQDDKLCLLLQSDSSGFSNSFQRNIYCYYYVMDMSEGKLLVTFSGQPVNTGQIQLKHTEMEYKDDTLYVFQKYNYKPAGGNTVSGTVTKSENCAVISAYRNSECVYQGKLLSGAHDDYVYQVQDSHNSFHMYIRDYYFLELD